MHAHLFIDAIVTCIQYHRKALYEISELSIERHQKTHNRKNMALPSKPSFFNSVEKELKDQRLYTTDTPECYMFK